MNQHNKIFPLNLNKITINCAESCTATFTEAFRRVNPTLRNLRNTVQFIQLFTIIIVFITFSQDVSDEIGLLSNFTSIQQVETFIGILFRLAKFLQTLGLNLRQKVIRTVTFLTLSIGSVFNTIVYQIETIYANFQILNK